MVSSIKGKKKQGIVGEEIFKYWRVQEDFLEEISIKLRLEG